MDTAIQDLRNRFLAEASDDPSKYHPIDIDRVQTEEWQVKRFLLEHNGNVDKALEHLKSSLAWKKQFGVHDLKRSDFPVEFYKYHNFEVYGQTREGALVHWEVVKEQYEFKELKRVWECFYVNGLEEIDRAAGEDGYVSVFDATGSGLSNVQMDFFKFKIQVTEHYPQGLKGLYIVNLPWMLNPPMKIVVALMSPKLRQMVYYLNNSSLAERIDPSFIPTRLGGLREQYYLPVESACISDLKMKQHWKLSDDFLERFAKTYRNHNKN